jgi:hypothetical protein
MEDRTQTLLVFKYGITTTYSDFSMYSCHRTHAALVQQAPESGRALHPSYQSMLLIAISRDFLRHNREALMSSPSPIITHYPTDFKGTEKRTLESGNFRVFQVFKLLPATMRWSMAGLRLQAIGKTSRNQN